MRLEQGGSSKWAEVRHRGAGVIPFRGAGPPITLCRDNVILKFNQRVDLHAHVAAM